MITSNQEERFIFIGGAPRSGTTLLQNMLDCHPDICGGPEFLHLPDILRLKQKMYKSIKAEYIDLFCTYEDVDRMIRNMISDFLLPLADKQDCKYLSEKTPENIMFFEDLIQLFPEAHYIHIVRDPRAVISSMIQVRKRALDKGVVPPYYTSNLAVSLEYLKRNLAAGFEVSKKYPEKILTVTYEELVRKPEEQTKRICEFLGIEWTEAMLYPERFSHLGEKAITTKSDEIWYDKKSYYRPPEAKDVDKWKKNLSPIQQILVTREFRKYEELSSLGYDFSNKHLSRVQRKSLSIILDIRVILNRISTSLRVHTKRLIRLSRIRSKLYFLSDY